MINVAPQIPKLLNAQNPLNKEEKRHKSPDKKIDLRSNSDKDDDEDEDADHTYNPYSFKRLNDAIFKKKRVNEIPKPELNTSVDTTKRSNLNHSMQMRRSYQFRDLTSSIELVKNEDLITKKAKDLLAKTTKAYEMPLQMPKI